MALKLSKRQKEVLEALRQGEVIKVNKFNEAFLGDAMLSGRTRYFLSEHRLITRLDKTRNVETSGNAFIISERGLKILSQQ